MLPKYTRSGGCSGNACDGGYRLFNIDAGHGNVQAKFQTDVHAHPLANARQRVRGWFGSTLHQQCSIHGAHTLVRSLGHAHPHRRVSITFSTPNNAKLRATLKGLPDHALMGKFVDKMPNTKQLFMVCVILFYCHVD